jgi:hypothetical protein
MDTIIRPLSVQVTYVTFLTECSEDEPRIKHLLEIHLLLDADATKLSGQMQILFPQTALATAMQSDLSVQLLPIPVQILE